jgi:hypothetical protein
MSPGRILVSALSLASLCALAACGRVVPDAEPPPVATPSPRPNPPPVLAPPPAAAWDLEPATPGTWTHRMAGRVSVAEFVSPQGRTLFQLTCTASREVELAATGVAPGARAMTVRTRTLERTVPADAREGAVATRLNPGDPLLAAMAYSRGRFAVEVPGLPALYLPSWPEVTRVVDDCQ